jgi:hypothetical protein
MEPILKNKFCGITHMQMNYKDQISIFWTLEFITEQQIYLNYLIHLFCKMRRNAFILNGI